MKRAEPKDERAVSRRPKNTGCYTNESQDPSPLRSQLCSHLYRYQRRGPRDDPLFMIFPRLMIGCINVDVLRLFHHFVQRFFELYIRLFFISFQNMYVFLSHVSNIFIIFGQIQLNDIKLREAEFRKNINL